MTLMLTAPRACAKNRRSFHFPLACESPGSASASKESAATTYEKPVTQGGSQQSFAASGPSDHCFSQTASRPSTLISRGRLRCSYTIIGASFLPSRIGRHHQRRHPPLRFRSISQHNDDSIITDTRDCRRVALSWPRDRAPPCPSLPSLCPPPSPGRRTRPTLDVRRTFLGGPAAAPPATRLNAGFPRFHHASTAALGEGGLFDECHHP